MILWYSYGWTIARSCFCTYVLLLPITVPNRFQAMSACFQRIYWKHPISTLQVPVASLLSMTLMMMIVLIAVSKRQIPIRCNGHITGDVTREVKSSLEKKNITFNMTLFHYPIFIHILHGLSAKLPFNHPEIIRRPHAKFGWDSPKLAVHEEQKDAY